jgi:hypothetical protein
MYKLLIAAALLSSLVTVASAQERVIRLGPNNTPPGLFKPKPNPPPAQFKGTCTVLPCGVKPVQFKPVVHRPIVHKPVVHKPVVHKPVRR